MEKKQKKQAECEQFTSIQEESKNLGTPSASGTFTRGARKTTVTWETGRIKSTGTLTIKIE